MPQPWYTVDNVGEIESPSLLVYPDRIQENLRRMIALAGGVGWAMADWVLRGRPTVDLSSADVRRFMPFQNNERALSKRIPEVLANHFEIPWPNHDYSTVRQIRRTPFHGVLKTHGAAFTQRGSWECPGYFIPNGTSLEVTPTYGRPNWFQLWAEEHFAARNGVALFDFRLHPRWHDSGQDIRTGSLARNSRPNPHAFRTIEHFLRAY